MSADVGQSHLSCRQDVMVTQHVPEDLGRIPTVADWLGRIPPESWMLKKGRPCEA